MKRLVTLVVVVLAGCATQYQPDAFTGGYSETQLDHNVFRVTFGGNAYVSPERVEDFALLRSAELTLEKGFTHFVIVDARARTDTNVVTTPGQSISTGSAYAAGSTAYGTAQTMYIPGQTIVHRKPTSTNTIICFKGRPDMQGMIYDARFVYTSITKKYGVGAQK